MQTKINNIYNIYNINIIYIIIFRHTSKSLIVRLFGCSGYVIKVSDLGRDGLKAQQAHSPGHRPGLRIAIVLTPC